MLIQDVMIRRVFTLNKTDMIKDAIELMQDRQIRHIPIVDSDYSCIGIVTDRDIRSAVPSIFYSEEQHDVFSRPIESIMTTNVITAHPLDFIEEVAAIFYRENIGCLPIVAHNRLIGIITETDVLRTFVELTGVNQPGSHLEVRVKNKPGILADVVEIIRQHHINIQSIFVYPDKSSQDKKILVFRIETINPNSIVDAILANDYEVLWPKKPRISP
ncbi:acetoin utilization AcuB family protein [Bacillus kwashiorkori]|uniref:acetoin utilization AcuB family protein n=1 Tax=Bacillus kwashiorkori TaxID=1522318 RepID=UPI0007856471|nr:acetoin utilization AcuB family protein [Bacillus kwashiorkori]